MNNVVSEAIQQLSSALTDRQVYLDVDMDPDLAPVMGDRVQLIQVLLNLFVNACEAMASTPPSERLIKVRTSNVPDGGVRVSVSDQGSGIPQDLVGRVGEPFITSKPRGLGLGLSISRSILVAHGGGLRPQNNPDRGATFQLVLPAAPTLTYLS
jgi:two-component system sensor kinase FixL